MPMILLKEKNYLIKACLLLVFAALIFAAFVPAPAYGSSLGGTWVINISGEIDPGQTRFVQNAYINAVTNGAEAIVFQIDTYGGYIDDAIKIKDIIMESKVPTICYVTKKAISAGALIALAGEKVAMRSGTTIGAAEPRVGNEIADEKVLSMWTAQLASVAEARGRDPQIAGAMSDANIVIDGLSEKGKLLTLTDALALNRGISDVTANSLDAVVQHFNLPSVNTTLEPTFQDKIAKALSSPYIAAILLMIGIAGILIEIFTAGFGVFGAVGFISMALYFAGNVWAGSAGIGAILLFVVGIILLLIEFFVTPGFGIPGVLGVLSMFGSIVWASPSFSYAAISLLIALVGVVVLLFISIKFGRTRKVWSRLILSVRQENEKGYVAPIAELSLLEGSRGKAVTTLRPAGTAVINDKRIDVVTDGEYIAADTEIEVVSVEGMRVVVREVK